MTVTIVDEVAAKLKGQTLHLPSLRDLYARWPNEISPHYDQLQKIIDDQISRRITDEHARRKAEKINVTFFSATYVTGPLMTSALAQHLSNTG
jgi:Txe/YoeB family toxin of Txe-Axe toxin-antitoxin module